MDASVIAQGPFSPPFFRPCKSATSVNVSPRLGSYEIPSREQLGWLGDGQCLTVLPEDRPKIVDRADLPEAQPTKFPFQNEIPALLIC
jgi:hypothetical protein